MYYGQFDPPVDRFLHERYFPNSPRGGVLIECGAFDGQLESSCKFFEESLGWRAINVEPSPAIYKKLTENRPKSTNLNLALSNAEKLVEFTEVDYPGHPLCTNGSVLHLEQHKQWLDERGCKYRTERVRATTYRSLIQLLKLTHVDLMVLDVEGYELVALEGFKDAGVYPSVLCVEHGHLGVDAVKQVIEPLGFLFDTTSHVNSFYIHRSTVGQLVASRGEGQSPWSKIKSLFGRPRAAA